MAIKDFYPLTKPTLDLNFAGSRTVDPRITFSRSGTGNVASYFDEKGVMKFAPSNVPRIDFDPVTSECKGLLIEEQRTNLLTYSEQFDNAVWGCTYATVTSNSLVAPDGSQTADKLVETGGTGALPRFSWSQNITNATIYTISIYAKEVSGSAKRYLQIYANSGFTQVSSSGSQGANFDLNSGTVTLTNGFTASISAVGNGWYRCTVIASASNSTTAGFGIALQDNPKAEMAAVWNPTGTGSVALWGAQLEVGSFPTSYIPTTTAQVTRAADSARLTGANFSNWYKQDEGTLFAEWATTTASSPYMLGVFSVSDGTPNERIQIRRNTSSSLLSFIALDGGTVQYVDVSLPFNGNAKSALAYKTNDFIGASNGALGVAATSGTLPTVSQADIGFGTGISQLNGCIKRIAYYPKRLSNINLQALTT